MTAPAYQLPVQRPATGEADLQPLVTHLHVAGRTQEEHDRLKMLAFLLVVVVVIGMALVFAIGHLTDETARQADATENLVAATDEVRSEVALARYDLAVVRYERAAYEIAQRKLVCAALQQGTPGEPTPTFPECAAGYITMPPKPEGYGS